MCGNCSPFEAAETTAHFSHVQTYSAQTSAPIYANDTIADSGTLYEEISASHGAGGGTMRVMVRALYDYQAVEDDELSLAAGNICVLASMQPLILAYYAGA